MLFNCCTLKFLKHEKYQMKQRKFYQLRRISFYFQTSQNAETTTAISTPDI